MPSITRRRALQGAVGLLAGLAGCNGEDADVGSPTREADRPRYGNIARDPPVYHARSSDGPLVWFADPREFGPDTPTAADPDGAPRYGLVASAEMAATLTVDDAVVDADAVRSFVDDTDFERETLYYEHRRVEACYRHELCYIMWNDADIETRYGRFLREHDVVCDADARDVEVRLIRVSDALDPERVDGGGSGVSNGDCFPLPRGRREAAPNGTDATSGSDGSDRPDGTDVAAGIDRGRPDGGRR
jgi:hypothetical protein